MRGPLSGPPPDPAAATTWPSRAPWLRMFAPRSSSRGQRLRRWRDDRPSPPGAGGVRSSGHEPGHDRRGPRLRGRVALYSLTPAAVDDGARMLAGLGTTFAVGIMAGLQLWGPAGANPGSPSGSNDTRRADSHGSGMGARLRPGRTRSVSPWSSRWRTRVCRRRHLLPMGVRSYSSPTPSWRSRCSRRRSPPSPRVDDGRRRVGAGGHQGRATLVLLVPRPWALRFWPNPSRWSSSGQTTSTLVAVALAGFARSLVRSRSSDLARTSCAVGRTRSPALVNFGVNVNQRRLRRGVASLGDSPGQVVAALAVSHALSTSPVACCHSGPPVVGGLAGQVFTWDWAGSWRRRLALVGGRSRQVLHVGSGWQPGGLVAGAVGALYLASTDVPGVHAVGLERLVVRSPCPAPARIEAGARRRSEPWRTGA